MIDFFSSWAKSLGLAIVVVSILEMLVPNNKMKKYIRMVMGIFILFNIISPIIENKDILDLNSIDFSQYTTDYENATNEKIDQTSMDERIAQLYKEEIEKDIIKKVEEQGFKVNNCKVSVNLEETTEQSKITKIKLNLEKNNETNYNQEEHKESIENTLVKEVQKIRKISIGSSEKNDTMVDINVSKADISNVKKFLIEEYEVNETCLEIN